MTGRPISSALATALNPPGLPFIHPTGSRPPQ
jgi:hypothetical protein